MPFYVTPPSVSVLFADRIPENGVELTPTNEKPDPGALEYIRADADLQAKTLTWVIAKIPDPGQEPSPSHFFHALDHRHLYDENGALRDLTIGEDGIAVVAEEVQSLLGGNPPQTPEGEVLVFSPHKSWRVVAPNYAAFLRFNVDPANGLEPAVARTIDIAFSATSVLLIEAKNWQESTGLPADTGRLAVAFQQLFSVMPSSLGETTKAKLVKEINALLKLYSMGFEVA